MTKKREEVEEAVAGPEVPPLRSAETPARLPPIPIGYRCAPPPPPPPEYLRLAPPVLPGRPDGWVCRRCTEWWEWHPYRPPTERELDVPCAECRKTIDADERAVEVNRLLLASLSAGSRPTMDVRFSPSSAPAVDAANDETDGIACSVDEAGRRLGCKRTMVFKLLKEGRLVAAPKLGRKRMVLVASVDALLEAGGVEGPAPARRAERTRRTGRVDGKTLAAEIAKLPVG
jgi:excisionase family DNA binding protein